MDVKKCTVCDIKTDVDNCKKDRNLCKNCYNMNRKKYNNKKKKIKFDDSVNKIEKPKIDIVNKKKQHCFKI